MNEVKLWDQIIEDLVQAGLDTMFGDGQERDMLVNGMSFKGYGNMTKAELVDEWSQLIGADPWGLQPDDMSPTEQGTASWLRLLYPSAEHVPNDLPPTEE